MSGQEENNSITEQKKLNGQSDNRTQIKRMRLPLSIGAAVLIWLILLISFFSKNDIKEAEFVKISEYMATDVY